MRAGRRVAIDVGKARIGVAVCDFHGILASGLATVARQLDPALAAGDILACLPKHELEWSEVIEVYVGLPTNLKASKTESTLDAIAVAKALAKLLTCDVRMIDERLTTVSAAAALRSSGINSKKGRSVIDQVAASLILEQALAFEKQTNQQPGVLLSEMEVEE